MSRSAPLLTIALVLAAAVALAVRTATGGPPLICHPIDIGDARSLAWGNSAFDRARGYSPERVVRDTLALLNPDTTVLVRMETMRRAAMYLDQDAAGREHLRAELLARIADTEAAGAPSALAWFDAGYFVQALTQLRARSPHSSSTPTSHEIAGYRWVAHALALQPDSAEMEFAAAMMTALANTPEHTQHVDRARRLAGKNSLLIRNMKHHGSQVWPHFQTKTASQQP